MRELSPDFQDLIGSFTSHNAEFSIVGAYELAFLGHTRYSEDIDLWIRCSETPLRCVPPRQTLASRSMTALRNSSSKIACFCNSA